MLKLQSVTIISLITMSTIFRDYVWECDYGEHSFVLRHIKNLLATLDPSQLAYCYLYANNNVYNLEFYVVFGYQDPLADQIDNMKQAMKACGTQYRPELTNDDLFAELSYKRFQFIAAADAERLDFVATQLFFYKDRVETTSPISMKPLGKALPVFLIHSSYDKPFIEELIPYLNAKGLPVWFHKVNIEYVETIEPTIQESIVDTGAVIFFTTYQFIASSWCKTEMEGFLKRYGSGYDILNGYDILILCVVSNEINHDQMPPFLQMNKYLRLTSPQSAATVSDELVPALIQHFKL